MWGGFDAYVRDFCKVNKRLLEESKREYPARYSHLAQRLGSGAGSLSTLGVAARQRDTLVAHVARHAYVIKKQSQPHSNFEVILK